MVSAWIKHVKQYAKTHKMKFGEAMRAAKKTWKGGQKGGQTTATGDVDDTSTVPAEMGMVDEGDSSTTDGSPIMAGTGEKLDVDVSKLKGPGQEGSRRRRRGGRKTRKHKGGQLYGFTGGPYVGSELSDGAGRFQSQPNTTWKNPSSELLRGGSRRRRR